MGPATLAGELRLHVKPVETRAKARADAAAGVRRDLKGLLRPLRAPGSRAFKKGGSGPSMALTALQGLQDLIRLLRSF